MVEQGQYGAAPSRLGAGLEVTCWCESRIVIVPKSDVAAGRTRSCGLPRCNEEWFTAWMTARKAGPKRVAPVPHSPDVVEAEEARGELMADEPITETPRVIPTTYGKFLAVARPGAEFRIGVIGETEAEAVELYAEAVLRWRALRDRQERAEAHPKVDEAEAAQCRAECRYPGCDLHVVSPGAWRCSAEAKSLGRKRRPGHVWCSLTTGAWKAHQGRGVG